MVEITFSTNLTGFVRIRMRFVRDHQHFPEFCVDGLHYRCGTMTSWSQCTKITRSEQYVTVTRNVKRNISHTQMRTKLSQNMLRVFSNFTYPCS